MGVACRKIESISGASGARREAAAAAGTNPAERRRLTTAGQTGRVSCVRGEKREKQ